LTGTRLGRCIGMLAAAALVGGCGSSAGPATTSTQATTPAQASTTPAKAASKTPGPAGPTPTTPTVETTPSAPAATSVTTTTTPAVESPLALCFAQIAGRPGLTRKQRSLLDELCRQIRGGSAAKH
jgi:hypothetical protein